MTTLVQAGPAVKPEPATRPKQRLFSQFYRDVMFGMGLSPLAFRTLAALTCHAYGRPQFKVTNIELADRMGVSVRTVQRGLAELKAKGVIACEYDAKDLNRGNIRFLIDVGPPAKDRPASKASKVHRKPANAGRIGRQSRQGGDVAAVMPPMTAASHNKDTSLFEGQIQASQETAGGRALDVVQEQEPEPIPAVEAEPAPSQPAPAARVEPAPAAAPAPSAEALEVAGWAKGHRPELEQVALTLCRANKVPWVRKAIERTIVNRGKWPKNPTAFLAAILDEWERRGTCEYIPGSTLANPTGRVAPTEAFRGTPGFKRVSWRPPPLRGSRNIPTAIGGPLR